MCQPRNHFHRSVLHLSISVGFPKHTFLESSCSYLFIASQIEAVLGWLPSKSNAWPLRPQPWPHGSLGGILRMRTAQLCCLLIIALQLLLEPIPIEAFQSTKVEATCIWQPRTKIHSAGTIPEDKSKQSMFPQLGFNQNGLTWESRSFEGTHNQHNAVQVLAFKQ